MNDGTCNQASATGRPGLDVLADRCDVEFTHAQGTRERSTPFGEFEALQIGMQPGTTTGSAATRVHLSTGCTRSLGDLDHPQQGGPAATFPAPHAHAHRSHDRVHGAVSAVGSTFGEPDPGPSLDESSATAHVP